MIMIPILFHFIAPQLDVPHWDSFVDLVNDICLLHDTAIAFYAGETVEERETDRRFAHVIHNMTKINIGRSNV